LGNKCLPNLDHNSTAEERRIKRATEVGKSVPPADPYAATAPAKRSSTARRSRRRYPMPPARCSFASGFCGSGELAGAR
jgi:hypothetical protein